MLAALVALVANGPVVALVVVSVVVAINQLDGRVLQPIVMGKALSLHPLVVLLALAGGGILAGIVGAVLAVPPTAFASAVLLIWYGSPAEPDEPAPGDLSSRRDRPTHRSPRGRDRSGRSRQAVRGPGIGGLFTGIPWTSGRGGCFDGSRSPPGLRRAPARCRRSRGGFDDEQGTDPQSATRSVDLVHVPLLPLSPEHPVETRADRLGGAVHFHPAGLLQRVFTAAGEVEAAEWALDQVLEAAASGEEVGIGLDVAPLDGALESARWALDRAVGALHAEIRSAARHGVPLVLLAEASATDDGELRSVLHPADALAGPGLVPGELAAAG